MTIIQEITRSILTTQYDVFDQKTLQIAKNKIIDLVGCIFGGAGTPGSRELVSLVKKWGGKKESSVLAYGGKLPACNAAMANAVMARSLDFEPVEAYCENLHAPAHISSTIIPAALAVAESRHSSGKEALTAIILAEDLTSRLTVASNYSLDLGWDCTGTVNVFGAAAAAGRLLRLNEAQMLNAFGIALNQMGGTMQSFYDKTRSFKLPQGLAARAGIFSAELAMTGFTGIKDALTSQFGYFRLYCKDSRPEILTRELGRKFYIDSVFKPYPSCRMNHAAIDCAMEIVRSHPLIPEQIEKVVVQTSQPVYSTFISQPFVVGDDPQIDAAFNLQFSVANALFRQSLKPEHLERSCILESGLAVLLKKIGVVPTLPPDQRLAARLVVTMKDGSDYSAFVEFPKGEPFANPMSVQELLEKYRANMLVSRLVSPSNAEKALKFIDCLEQTDDTCEIFDILAPQIKF
jgi:2-methylcitrate dehydratase PrpD